MVQCELRIHATNIEPLIANYHPRDDIETGAPLTVVLPDSSLLDNPEQL
jgi:hypothetical protein